MDLEPFALLSPPPGPAPLAIALCWLRLVLGGGRIITEELADEDCGEGDLNGEAADEEDEDEKELPLMPANNK